MAPSTLDPKAVPGPQRGGRMRALLVALTISALAATCAAQSTDATDLSVGEHPQIAAHLVGADGRTLYVFAEDAPFTATCVDACAERWEPVRFAGLVPTATGLSVVLVGIATRGDGTTQATYAGMPLYTFVEDVEPGSILGLDGSGMWSAVAPDGTLITAIAPAEDSEAMVLTPEEVLALGQEVYATYCAACHSADGSGNIGPSLVSNARLADNAFVARQLRDGLSEMPGFGSILTNEQLAAVATLVRSRFGNAYPPMAPDEFER